MSDFINSGWSLFVSVITALSILACAWILWYVGKQKVGPAGETTGHVWDENLVELNNPMPRWWMGLFYITIVFAIAYLVLYPGMGSFAGVLGWTQTGQHEAEAKQLDALAKPLYDGFMKKNVADLARDSNAKGVGERLFLNNCAQCHGSDGRGAKGYPNLTDGDWLWGGDAEAIKTSIVKGRAGLMPPMAAAVGSEADVENLVQYVMSLSGAGDPTKAALGKDKFAVCGACHGADGKGNPALGAPNLTDNVWLHGGGQVMVAEAIRKGRGGVMPAHEGRLTEGQLHVLTAYVWGLSNGAGGTPAGAGK